MILEDLNLDSLFGPKWTIPRKGAPGCEILYEEWEEVYGLKCWAWQVLDSKETILSIKPHSVSSTHTEVFRAEELTKSFKYKHKGWIQGSTKVFLRFMWLPLHIGIVIKSRTQSENWLQILWLNYAACFQNLSHQDTSILDPLRHFDSLVLIHAAPDKTNNLWQKQMCVENVCAKCMAETRKKKNLHGKQEKKPFKQELW